VIRHAWGATLWILLSNALRSSGEKTAHPLPLAGENPEPMETGDTTREGRLLKGLTIWLGFLTSLGEHKTKETGTQIEAREKEDSALTLGKKLMGGMRGRKGAVAGSQGKRWKGVLEVDAKGG